MNPYTSPSPESFEDVVKAERAGGVPKLRLIDYLTWWPPAMVATYTLLPVIILLIGFAIAWDELSWQWKTWAGWCVFFQIIFFTIGLAVLMAWMWWGVGCMLWAAYRFYEWGW